MLAMDLSRALCVVLLDPYGVMPLKPPCRNRTTRVFLDDTQRIQQQRGPQADGVCAKLAWGLFSGGEEVRRCRNQIIPIVGN